MWRVSCWECGWKYIREHNVGGVLRNTYPRNTGVVYFTILFVGIRINRWSLIIRMRRMKRNITETEPNGE